VLFVVFAGYIVDLHNSINLATVRLEAIQEKNNQLISDLTAMRRGLFAQPTMMQQQQLSPPAPEAQQAEPPKPLPSSGVEISEPAPIEPDEKGDMTPAVLPPPASAAPQAAPTPNK